MSNEQPQSQPAETPVNPAPAPATPPSASPPQSPNPPAEAYRPRFQYSARSRECEREQQQRQGSGRETVESVVIAFVLAFLFRTFEAEAFVIPTGSMAPTLMGRHKEVACSECGWLFTIGYTEDSGSTPLSEGICPNCRFINRVADQPAFKGDRILVLKALYDLPGFVPGSLREPKRWDVVVFKFPEEPQINYIKRLVGLPNEELNIHYGNIFTRTRRDGEFTIARKSPAKQRVMRMLVFDNNHQSPNWKSHGWAARWQPETDESWRESDSGKSFEFPPSAAATANGDAWTRLEYHHFPREWGEPRSTTAPPREQLVTDFYAYNAGMNDGYFRDFVGSPPPHWVGDLSLDARLDVREATGKVRLELVEAGDRFICEFDLDSGECRLLRRAAGESEPTPLTEPARNAIRRTGKYAVSFSNIDDRLTVWVDNRLVFNDGHDYDGAKLGAPQRPTEADLRPAAVAVHGANVRVSDLVLYRDIYYTHGSGSGSGPEYYGLTNGEDTLSTPSLWSPIESAEISRFEPLGPDNFMMCGDNSPRSKDGRLWEAGARHWVRQLAREQADTFDLIEADRLRDEIATRPGGQVVLADRHVVHRDLLIGRAFYIYWPHGVPFGPDWVQFDTPELGPLGNFRLPFYPNVARMKMIE